MLPQKTQGKANSKAPSKPVSSQGNAVEEGNIEIAISDVQHARPVDIKLLQMRAGNRAVNRLINSQPLVRNRTTATQVQRQFSKEVQSIIDEWKSEVLPHLNDGDREKYTKIITGLEQSSRDPSYCDRHIGIQLKYVNMTDYSENLRQTHQNLLNRLTPPSSSQSSVPQPGLIGSQTQSFQPLPMPSFSSNLPTVSNTSSLTFPSLTQFDEEQNTSLKDEDDEWVEKPSTTSKNDNDDGSDTSTKRRRTSSTEHKHKKEHDSKKRKKKKEKEKKEKKKEKKKGKKEKKEKNREPREETREEKNRRYLREDLEMDFVYFDAPVRRHRIREITFDDIKGHSQYTTVSGDDMAAYTRQINDGDFSRHWIANSGALRVEMHDGRIFGCTIHREGNDLMLYPVEGPTCSSLTYDQLHAMVRIRDAQSVDELTRKWYKETDIQAAIEALKKAGIEIK